MVIHLKKTETLNFNMEDRLTSMLDGDKAIQLAQVASDAIKEALIGDDSNFGEACRHRDNFYSTTNPTLFDDLLNMSETDAKRIVFELYIKK
mgnify:CR=1 FL=1